jgi:Secretion system C-terminal sorting domain
MNKTLILFMLLFILNSLTAQSQSFNQDNFGKTDYITFEEDFQPYTIISHKDFIVRSTADDYEILSGTPEKNIHNNNSREVTLTLHFNRFNPEFYANCHDYSFSNYDANWIDGYTAECYIPEGIYNVYTLFEQNISKLVVRNDMDLTTGATNYDLWIEDDEANIELTIESYYSNGEPFYNGGNYRANFFFHFINEQFVIISTSNVNHMLISSITNNYNFVCGECKFDGIDAHLTQYGPISEISNDITFSNNPEDYIHQQIHLQVPDSEEDLKIIVSNSPWEKNIYHLELSVQNQVTPIGNEWSMNLYMMDQIYDYCNTSLVLIIGYWYEAMFKEISYCPAFHCFDDKIGSFWDFVPKIVDYLSPDGETIQFGQAPIYFCNGYYHNNNQLIMGSSINGYNNDRRKFDLPYSTYCLEDSQNNLIAQGGLTEILVFNIFDDDFTMTVVDNNLALAGLEGICTLINKFDGSLEHANPPFINSFMIINEEGKPVNRLEQNENATVMFIFADIENDENYNVSYCPVVNDSVRVYCKLHNETQWQEYETDFVIEYPDIDWTFGKVFSANISETTLLDSVFYDVKIHFEDQDDNSTELILEPAFVVGNVNITGISQEETTHSTLTSHLFNYPNPFNPNTIIEFEIKEGEKGIFAIYNLLGQKILEESFSEGDHQYHWNAEGLASGIYLYKITTPTYTESKKMILLK